MSYRGTSLKQKGIISDINKAALFLLWFSGVFDPVGKVFYLRQVALIFAFFCLFINIVALNRAFRISQTHFALFLLFSFILPLQGFLVGLFRGGLSERFIDTSYFSAGVFFVTSLLYLDSGLGIDEVIRLSVIVLRLSCLAIFFCLLTTIFNWSRMWISELFYRGVLFYGNRNYGGVGFYYFYFLASPMLIMLLSYDSWRFFEMPSLRRCLLLIVSIASLFLSGTRAEILLSLIALPFIYLWRKFGKMSMVIMLGMVLLSFLISTSPVVASFFSAYESSNNQKLSYLIQYGEIFQDPTTLIIGQGFNAQAWSPQFASIIYGDASKTELTYLEYFRVFGLFGIISAFIVGFTFLVDIKKVPMRYRWIEPCLVMYLAISAVNPYIFSSNGMLIFGMFAAIISKSSVIWWSGNFSSEYTLVK
jgi:hypothetical protein